MANSAKAKGDRAELEIARLLHDLTGDPVRRKLGAGRLDDTGDLDGLTDTTAQVKNFADITRALREALHDLPTQQANAGTPYAVAFIRRPGGNWAACMNLEQWAALYRSATA
jgi:hypothetical protein